MNHSFSPVHRVFRLLVLIFLSAILSAPAIAATSASVASTPLPGASVYQVDVPLVDQDGHAFALRERRGRAQLVSMFYTSCDFVCPMLIDTLRQTLKQLTPEERNRLNVLLMTFDPARDDVAVLKGVADKRNLGPAHWTLARPSVRDARRIAAVLNVQYRALANGDFNHTTSLILLDPEGRIVARTGTLGDIDRAFIEQIRKTLRDLH
jgi:protein SCO1/2